jgi:hypothetical protein
MNQLIVISATGLIGPEPRVATLPLGTVAYEPQLNAKGERLIWLSEEVWLSKLDPMRKPGETYCDVTCGWSNWARTGKMGAGLQPEPWETQKRFRLEKRR